MDKTFKGYINYGCLAAEKRPVFTAENPDATAIVSNPVEYSIPEGWELYETVFGNMYVETPWGRKYDPNELLEGKEDPYFAGIDAEGSVFRKKLDWKKL